MPRDTSSNVPLSQNPNLSPKMREVMRKWEEAARQADEEYESETTPRRLYDPNYLTRV